MFKSFKSITLSSGFAMFAMFFGAGNLVFPLIIGRFVEGDIFSALAGLLATAVLIPFVGLISMTLYKGDYFAFFNRLGKIPGMLMLILVIALIGPFGGIPRCITLTYAALTPLLPWMNAVWFTIIAGAIVFFFSWKPGRIIDLIGYVLTPLLLISLAAILVKGLFFSPHTVALKSFSPSSFAFGLKEGYNTMDLPATFFFASIVYQSLKDHLQGTSGKIVSTSLKASCIAAGLLALVYAGFCYLAASHSHLLIDTSTDQLLPKIGALVLGPVAEVVIAGAVSMACLTTAIGLVSVSSEFLQNHVLNKKLSYVSCLLIVLMITGLCSMLGFTGIVKMLGPVLSICYPGFIALCLVNLLHKTLNFKPVKTPVFFVLATMTIINLL